MMQTAVGLYTDQLADTRIVSNLPESFRMRCELTDRRGGASENRLNFPDRIPAAFTGCRKYCRGIMTSPKLNVLGHKRVKVILHVSLFCVYTVHKHYHSHIVQYIRIKLLFTM